MSNMKKTWQGINELLHRRKRNLKVISAQKDFNSRNKIVKEGSRIPNVINKHLATAGNRPANNLLILQKRHLNYVDKCKSPISSFLFNQFYPKNYCQKYYLYRMINLMVYTPHLPNFSKCSSAVIAPELIHQSSKLLQITAIFKRKDDTDANNYWPISLFSNFDRVFDKII